MHTPLVERAFQLAKSGVCDSVRAVRDRLQREGYMHADVDSHLSAPNLSKQLSGLCRAYFMPNYLGG